MLRMLSVLAAIFVLCMIALPGTAQAAQRGPDGIRNLDQTELSARRHVRRYNRGRYYGPYSYQPYYYRPYVYYGPAPFPVFPFFWW